jgi:hypothetical protein
VSGTALWYGQDAIVDRVRTDVGAGGVMTKISGIFDYVKDAQAFPYISLGEGTETPFLTFGRNGHENVFTLHIWSQKKGYKECYQILDALVIRLDGFALVVTGHDTVLLEYDGGDSMRDPDGITRHVAARFRLVTQDAP